jgi:hypothetical protein
MNTKSTAGNSRPKKPFTTIRFYGFGGVRGEQSAVGVLQMTNVHWIKCDGNNWCPFERVNLSGVNTTGVYVIWHGGNPARTVRVGQGDIADRLTAHRNDSSVMNYRQHGLWVTWAAVPHHQLDGVERYLSDLLKPLVGSRFPDVAPLAVNSPFAA